MKAMTLLAVLLQPIAVCSCCTAASTGSLEAGVGRCVITPKQSMWLSGYASRKEPSSGKIHDLYAKALAVRDENGETSVIVTTDLIGLSAEVSRKTAEGVQEKFSIPRERLMLTASHTHSGPVMLDNLINIYPLDEEQLRLVSEYTDELPGLLVQAIESALADLEPCTLKWGVGQAGFAANRREYTPGGVINRHNPIGPVDHDVPVLAVCREDGTTKGVLFGYACHNTTLAVQKFNGDYAGFAQEHIETSLPGVTALFAAGCGADQNPLPRRKIELAQKYGHELGDAVLSVLNGEMDSVKGPIRAAYKEIPLDLTDPPSREEIEKQTESDNVYVKRRAEKMLKTIEEKGVLETVYPYPVQVWRFSDDLQMTTLAGEAVVDYSLLIKHEFGKDKQFVIAYANDLCAYIPSLRVLREGGYEGADAMLYYGLHGPWKPNVEESVMKAVRELAAME